MLTISPALAEMFSYTDDNGKTWYVNRKEAIPEQYRPGMRDLGLEEVSYTKAKTRPVSSANTPDKGESKKDEIKVYVTSWCPACRQLESFLRRNNIAYKRYDIERSRTGQREYKKLGGGGIPVVSINGAVHRGFQPDKFRSLIQ